MMKIFAVIIFAFSTTAIAENYNLLETTDEARARHNAERYKEYKDNNRQIPLGGYSEKFGDTAPPGTYSPGSSTTHQYKGGQGRQNSPADSLYR